VLHVTETNHTSHYFINYLDGVNGKDLTEGN